ncbi:MAG: penicillin-binding protein 2 [Lachnospiraceae bacterium]|nr:penicillin-binding protein 2 [Lachnospiraceae bacterium]
MNSNRERKIINKTRRKINRGRIINQDILKIAIFFCALAAALIVYLCFFLTFRSSAVINNRYNKRSDSFKKVIERGTIYSSDGTPLAYSQKNGEDEVRIYPYGNAFAQVIGYEANGGLGLESSYNYYLLTSHTNMFEKISNEFKGEKNPGDSIHTTLDVDLQVYVSDLLSGLKASAICIDPQTGHILADVSKPDFDPNQIEVIWEDIIEDEENSPLVNRVTQGQYTPGSTFKIFTLLEFIRENNDYDSFQYDCSGTLEGDGYSMSCIDQTAHGIENLTDAFAWSCNLAFANIGLKLNLSRFQSNNEDLLFNTELPIDIDSNPATYSLKESDSDFLIMQTAFGQGKTMTNPLHLSFVMCAFANDGVLMTPHFVTQVTSPSGASVKKWKDKEYKRLCSEKEASIINEYLRAVVTEGTGNILCYEDYTAYGKTGTAETKSDKEQNIDMSFFVGYAEKDGQKLVVCVNIEDTRMTWMSAVDYAHEIFNYYFYY